MHARVNSYDSATEQSCSGRVAHNYEATQSTDYIVQVSMKTAVLGLQFLIKSLHTYLSHFQFTETQEATFLYCSPKSTLPSGTIISLDTPLSFVWGLVEANLYTIGCSLQV